MPFVSVDSNSDCFDNNNHSKTDCILSNIKFISLHNQKNITDLALIIIPQLVASITNG